ncbi:MAG: ABC transporter substrate-binding protein [Christensenellales bacterium]
MKKTVKFLAMLLVMVMAITAFASCAAEKPVATTDPASTAANTQAPAATEAPKFDGQIRFGVILSLTGDAAANHARAKDGIELACKEINEAGGVLGKEVVLQIEDEQTTPDGCVLATSKLYSTDMVALLGPNRTAHTIAINDQITKGGKPVICWSTGAKITKDNQNPWLFFGRPSDLVTVANAAKFMGETLGLKKIGLFTVNDDYGTACKEVLMDTFDELGVEYVDGGHNAGDKDFSGQILAFKNAGCDGVTSWTHSAEVALFARQRVELGFTVPYVGSVSITESNTTDLLDATTLEGIYSVCDAAPDAADPVMKEIIAKCKATFGYEINVMYMACHSTLNTVCWAIDKAGSTEPDKIAEALRSLDGTQISTAEGKMICNDQQVLTALCLIVQYDNAKTLHTIAQLG